MNEKKIQELLDLLFSQKIMKKHSDGDSYSIKIIEEQGRGIINEIIRGFLFENRDSKIGELEAKVFMYEQIIMKSNFAPMISKLNEEM